MISLSELVEKHVKNLQVLLHQIPKPNLQINLSGVDHSNKAEDIGRSTKELEKTMDVVNKNFVTELNDEIYEKSFSDENRLEAYKNFRLECSKLVATFNDSFLSPSLFFGSSSEKKV